MPPLKDDQHPHAPSTLLSTQLWIRKRYVLEHVNGSRLAWLVRDEKNVSISSTVLYITEGKCVQISVKRRLRKYIQRMRS